MAKKRARKEPPKTTPRAKAGRKRWSSSRSTTHKANGSLPESMAVPAEPVEKVPVGEAMRRAVENLGDRTITNELLESQMNELADCYEEIAKRQAAYDARSEDAKTAKKSLESAQALLLEKVRAFTHARPMPLFDAVQREDDQQRMLDGESIGAQ